MSEGILLDIYLNILSLLAPTVPVYLPCRQLTRFASIFAFRNLTKYFPMWDILYKGNAHKLNCQQPPGFLHLCSTGTFKNNMSKTELILNFSLHFSVPYLDYSRLHPSSHPGQKLWFLLEQWYSKCGLQMSQTTDNHHNKVIENTGIENWRVQKLKISIKIFIVSRHFWNIQAHDHFILPKKWSIMGWKSIT